MDINGLSGIVMDFTFEQMKRDVGERLVKAVDAGRKEAETEAKRNVAVKTGAMRDSIHSGIKVKNGNPIGYVKSKDKGAFSQEYGHGTHQPAPFMRPAVNKAAKDLLENFKI